MFTKKFMKKLISVFFLLMLTACATENPSQVIGYPANRSVPRTAPSDDYEELYMQDDEIPISFAVLHRQPPPPRGMFEPAYGTYLGAWLRDNTTFREFESLVETRHAVYVYEMHLGNDVPINWVLQCIAARATPLIVVHMPEEDVVSEAYYLDYGFEPQIDNSSIEDEIVLLAQNLGALNLPMFVAFFPPGHGLPADEYRLLFRYARAKFMEYASMTAFVWVAPSKTADASSPYYPGHDAVDWVGVQLLSKRNAYGFVSDILVDFEPLYMAFSQYKPIAILPLGISHLTRENFIYSVECAAAEIKRVYNALGAAFPRVGMVVYGDAFFMNYYTNDDFSVTLDSELTAAYRSVIQSSHFISALEKVVQPVPELAWARSFYHGYHYEGAFYVDIRTLENELRRTAPRQQTEINGRMLVNVDRLQSLNINVCEDGAIIFLE